MSDYHANALAAALRRVAAYPGAATLVGRVAKNSSAVADQLQQAVLTEVQEFSKSRNPDLLPELAEHGREIVEEVVRLLSGGSIGRFEFVRQHARRRAEQRFPMEATLHAYRSGHKVLSRWLRDSVVTQAIAAIGDFSMEFFDAISTTFAGSYATHALLLAELAGDQRSELLRVLLDGYDEADLRAARVLRAAGFLGERQFFCIALARSVDPTEMLDVSRARRMADAIEQNVAALGVRRVIDVYDNKVTMVFVAVSRDSGWTAPRASLATQVRAILNLVGNAALIGVSNDVPSTSHLPAAYREAKTALELATVSQRVMQFSEIPLRRLVLHFAAQDLGHFLPAWATTFYHADDKANGALVETLRTYARLDMNILKAGEELSLHPNTIYARLQRIFDISGLQPRSFEALNDLLIVCDSRPAASGRMLDIDLHHPRHQPG